MVLIFTVQLDEVGTPAPDAYDQLAVLLGMLLCCLEYLGVNGIELQLVSAQLNKGFDKGGNLMDAFGRIKHGSGKFQRERAAVDGAFQMRLGEDPRPCSFRSKRKA